jgi:deferrochelatase/peroxidase EfeB
MCSNKIQRGIAEEHREVMVVMIMTLSAQSAAVSLVTAISSEEAGGHTPATPIDQA